MLLEVNDNWELISGSCDSWEVVALEELVISGN
jgi:hypothetical protein